MFTTRRAPVKIWTHPDRKPPRRWNPQAPGRVLVRYGTPADLGAIAALNTRVWLETSDSVSEGLEEENRETELARQRMQRGVTRKLLHGVPQRGEGALAVAFAGRECIGVAQTGRARDVDAPRPLELYSIRVARDFHGTGVAGSLLDLTLGHERAYLWVGEDNTRGLAFYSKHGFAPSTLLRARGGQRCLTR